MCFASSNEHSDVAWELPTLSIRVSREQSRPGAMQREKEVNKSAMSEAGSIQPEPEFAAFIGIDWADQKHIWCLQAAGSARRETGELEHTPEAVESWVAHLYQRFAQRPMAVAVEQSRGALVFLLSKYEPLHLFPVPSQMASSMRQALDPRAPRMILEMPICCWISCCSIATGCVVYRRIAKPPAECRI